MPISVIVIDCVMKVYHLFTGEFAGRRSPCRHISQHREMSGENTVDWGTTYGSTFKPMNSPACTNNAVPPTHSSSRPPVIYRTMGPIPTPFNTPIHYKRHLTTPVSQAGTCRQPHTPNVLTLVECNKCNNYKENCSCK